MTELQLYKFINDNDVEWHHQEKDGHPDVLVFPRYWQIEDFAKLFEPSKFDDGGIECFMMDGYFAFWMQDICDYYGIELDKVFTHER
jgi:hypothetical protein